MSAADLLRSMPGIRHGYAPGEPLFHRNDRITRLHLVEEGAVELMRHLVSGSPILLQRASAGDILAEASIHARHYHCSGIAASAARTWAVRVSDVRARLRDDREFAETWSRHLAEEVQAARLRSEIRTLRTVAERLDALIEWRGEGALRKGGWNKTAAEIGVSPEALYRELARRRGAV